jgi:hypothetical protein
MRIFSKLTLCVVLPLVLAGCAESWEKPGGTEQEFEATKALCTNQAYHQFPPLVHQVQTSGGYVKPPTTNCTGNDDFTNCSTSGGKYVAPTSMIVDDNLAARDQAVRACFFANGWQPVKSGGI